MKTDLKVFSTQALDFTPSFASLYVKYYSLCSWRRPNDNPAHKFLQTSLLVNSLFLLVLYYLYFYYCATYKSNQFKSRYLYTQLSVILPQNSFELNGKKIIFVPMLSPWAKNGSVFLQLSCMGPSSATLSSPETTPLILFSFSLQCGAWSRAILQLSSSRSSKQI